VVTAPAVTAGLKKSALSRRGAASVGVKEKVEPFQMFAAVAVAAFDTLGDGFPLVVLRVIGDAEIVQFTARAASFA